MNKHERRLIVDRDLLLRAMEWHGGQWSGVYSLTSTGLEGLVSIAMVERAIAELELDLARARKEPHTAESRKDRADLEEIIGELDAVRCFPDEHDAMESGGSFEEPFDFDGLHDDECACCNTVRS